MNASLLLATLLVAVALSLPSTPVVPPKTRFINAPSPNIAVIAHRGAPFYVPEHTAASYSIAASQGVDWIEPDVCLTKDGQLVVLHDLELSTVTDIASRPEFAGRNRTLAIRDDKIYHGWIVSDFTLAELKTLRVNQRVRTRSHLFDGFWQLLTFNETLALIDDLNAKFNRTMGVYVEPKEPGFFQSIGLRFEEPLIAAFEAHGYPVTAETSRSLPVMIECFEIEFLKSIRQRTNVRLVLLVDTPTNPHSDLDTWEHLTLHGLQENSKYVEAIGPHKMFLESSVFTNVLADDYDGLLVGKELIDASHQLNISVHPFTLRTLEEEKESAKLFHDELAEHLYHLHLGVDGFFTESAEIAECALRINELLKERSAFSDSIQGGQSWLSFYFLYAMCFVVGVILGVILTFLLSRHYFTKRLKSTKLNVSARGFRRDDEGVQLQSDVSI